MASSADGRDAGKLSSSTAAMESAVAGQTSTCSPSAGKQRRGTEPNSGARQNDAQNTDDVEKLPALSAAEFKALNRLAVKMEYFHTHFRQTWTALYSSCSSSPPPSTSGIPFTPLSASRLISLGLEFVSHLTLHHDIEETHVFPYLAQRMPQFAAHSEAAGEMVQQHRVIHDGLEKMETYLEECRRGERELRREEVKALMDVFGEVLWSHLEKEVEALGAESMRKYWTPAEVNRIIM